jgi:acid phosphatase
VDHDVEFNLPVGAVKNTSHMMGYIPSFSTLGLILLCMLTLSTLMKFHGSAPALLADLVGHTTPSIQGNICALGHNVSLAWYPPSNNSVNNLVNAINGTGADGLAFTSNPTTANTSNWCNMPHINIETYVKPSQEYKLKYVEVIHRHHKRTPYAANTFPREGYSWDCFDEGLFYGGKPLNPYGNGSAATYWAVYTSPSNPLPPMGFNGTCQFPQISRGGLDDSYQHGLDLKAVYGDMLGFIPENYDAEVVSYRVTNNVITSQVASVLIAAMYPSRKNLDTPLLVQPDSIDSLEPAYTCSAGSQTSYGPGSQSPAWQQHLTASASLFARLDALSGVPSNDSGFHISWDHYFDNLSARLCHSKPLPCQIGNETDCVSQPEADEVFRLGQYEYSFIYRDAPQSLPMSVASYGI